MTSTRLPVQIYAEHPLNVSSHSLVTEMRYLYDASIVINCTGITTNTGAFTAETSNDGVLWIPLDIDSAMTLTGSDHIFYLTIMGLNSDLLRLSFTPANADGGVVTATLEAKAEA
jgi:hypothetical protein